MTDVTDLGEIRVVGQRRRSDGTFPSRGSGAGGGGNNDTGAPEQEEVDPGDFTPDVEQDPCRDPATALEWNADAAAAEATKEFERLAAQRNPPETLNNREWGAALFQMPNGRVVVGNIRSGDSTFQNPGPTGRPNVDIDWSGPPGGLLVGMVHSHGAGGHVPSGYSPTSDDQDSLRYIREVRTQAGANPNQARLYISALTMGPAGTQQSTRINVYNHTNQAQAINGEEGPEVNPEAQPCS